MSNYLGCGDNSCFIETPTGMGTNGGCRCVQDIVDSRTRNRVRMGLAGMKCKINELEKQVKKLTQLLEEKNENTIRT